MILQLSYIFLLLDMLTKLISFLYFIRKKFQKFRNKLLQKQIYVITLARLIKIYKKKLNLFIIIYLLKKVLWLLLLTIILFLINIFRVIVMYLKYFKIRLKYNYLIIFFSNLKFERFLRSNNIETIRHIYEGFFFILENNILKIYQYFYKNLKFYFSREWVSFIYFIQLKFSVFLFYFYSIYKIFINNSFLVDTPHDAVMSSDRKEFERTNWTRFIPIPFLESVDFIIRPFWRYINTLDRSLINLKIINTLCLSLFFNTDGFFYKLLKKILEGFSTIFSKIKYFFPAIRYFLYNILLFLIIFLNQIYFTLLLTINQINFFYMLLFNIYLHIIFLPWFILKFFIDVYFFYKILKIHLYNYNFDNLLTHLLELLTHKSNKTSILTKSTISFIFLHKCIFSLLLIYFLGISFLQNPPFGFFLLVLINFILFILFFKNFFVSLRRVMTIFKLKIFYKFFLDYNFLLRRLYNYDLQQILSLVNNNKILYLVYGLRKKILNFKFSAGLQITTSQDYSYQVSAASNFFYYRILDLKEEQNYFNKDFLTNLITHYNHIIKSQDLYSVNYFFLNNLQCLLNLLVLNKISLNDFIFFYLFFYDYFSCYDTFDKNFSKLNINLNKKLLDCSYSLNYLSLMLFLTEIDLNQVNPLFFKKTI